MGHRVAVTISILFPHHAYKHSMHPQTRADATGIHFKSGILIMSRRGSSQSQHRHGAGGSGLGVPPETEQGRWLNGVNSQYTFWRLTDTRDHILLVQKRIGLKRCRKAASGCWSLWFHVCFLTLLLGYNWGFSPRSQCVHKGQFCWTSVALWLQQAEFFPWPLRTEDHELFRLFPPTSFSSSEVKSRGTNILQLHVFLCLVEICTEILSTDPGVSQQSTARAFPLGIVLHLLLQLHLEPKCAAMGPGRLGPQKQHFSFAEAHLTFCMCGAGVDACNGWTEDRGSISILSIQEWLLQDGGGTPTWVSVTKKGGGQPWESDFKD